METGRLERLAVLLDQHVERPGANEFDLSEWGIIATRRGGFLWLKQVECGTCACAVGLACLSGAFIEDGLRHIKDGSHIDPLYAGLNGYAAVRAFFGLTKDQALTLFNAGHYEISAGPIAAAAVAHRIRQLVKRSNRAKASNSKRRMTAAVEKIKFDALAAPKQGAVVA